VVGTGNGSFSDATFRTTAYQLSDEVNVVRGNHQIAFGVIGANWRENNHSHTASLGAYTFNGSVTGLGMADFLTGNLATLNEGSETLWSDRQAYILGYGQDTWKVTPRLTASLGLRWEPSQPLALKQGAVYGFDIGRYQQGIVSQVYPNAPPGVYFPGDPGFPSGGRTTIRDGTSLRHAWVSHLIQTETVRRRFAQLSVWHTISTQLCPWAAWPLRLRLRSAR
jgi:TonB dependent receptor